MLLFAKDLLGDTETGLQDLGGGIGSLIGGTDTMNMVHAPVLGAPTDNYYKIEKYRISLKLYRMKRYFICHKKEKKPEFVEGIPVEILSPLYKHLQPLPTKKEELELLDFEIIEQLHLLQAEYNKRFQEAKHCINKDDMLRGVHFLSRSNDVKKRMLDLEKRHTDIQIALDAIRLPIQALRIKIPKST
jgi:hypothetical protein